MTRKILKHKTLPISDNKTIELFVDSEFAMLVGATAFTGTEQERLTLKDIYAQIHGHMVALDIPMRYTIGEAKKLCEVLHEELGISARCRDGNMIVFRNDVSSDVAAWPSMSIELKYKSDILMCDKWLINSEEVVPNAEDAMHKVEETGKVSTFPNIFVDEA